VGQGQRGSNGVGSDRATLPLKAFQVIEVQPQVALVTYVSEVQQETLERANRSSLWVRGAGVWRLVFHQGTPVE